MSRQIRKKIADDMVGIKIMKKNHQCKIYVQRIPQVVLIMMNVVPDGILAIVFFLMNEDDALIGTLIP